MSAPEFPGLDKPPAVSARRPPPHQHWIRHVLRQVLGWTLIILGLIDIPLPGPGWLIVGLGAIVLAPYVKLFYNFVEWIKKKFPALREPLDRFERRCFGTPENPPPPPPDPPR